MILFTSDYTEGCHERILDALTKTNMEQTVGYGQDEYCEKAKEKIKAAFSLKHSDIHFLVGGTQTNTTVISAVLKPYQGVISPDTGHINVHETGAIESRGHKVITVSNKDGKLSAEQIAELYDSHISDESKEHTVMPKMAYISFPAETGTIYSKQELCDIYETCKKCGIYLFIDGARLGYGLSSEKCDVSPNDLENLCDVFYIGGTKVGALFGEALVITNDQLKPDFRYMIKQCGGMLAKGRLLGIQFAELFTDNLYFDISKHAVKLAARLKDAFIKKGYTLFADSYTNQQFVILSNSKADELKQEFGFELWQRINNDKSAYRFCTSWATKEENIEKLIMKL